MRHLALAGILALSSFPAFAGEETIYAAPGPTRFTVNEQVGALNVEVASPRYARPSNFLGGMDFPDLAGAPVPVDPVDLVGPYAEGALVVPSQRVHAYAGDAKGSAARDAHARVRSGPRMAW